MAEPIPATNVKPGTPAIIIDPSWVDEDTGAVYLHKDLVQVKKPHEDDAYIKPIEVDLKFGNVQSWAAYIERYGNPAQTLISWSETGIQAQLDYHYHEPHAEALIPGRCTHMVRLPFQPTREFTAWSTFANDNRVSQSAAIEHLERWATTISEPDTLTLLKLIASLRGNVNATVESELQAHGTNLKFSRSTSVISGVSEVALPSEITVSLPVIKGHEVDGKPQAFALPIKVRTSVGDDHKLSLRFTLIGGEEAVETAAKEMVAQAAEALGEQHAIYKRG